MNVSRSGRTLFAFVGIVGCGSGQRMSDGVAPTRDGGNGDPLPDATIGASAGDSGDAGDVLDGDVGDDAHEGADVLSGDAPDAGSPSWQVEDSGTTNWLSGVWAAAADDVYVVGAGGLVLHSKGDGIWERRPFPALLGLDGIHGSNANDIYVNGLTTTYYDGGVVYGGLYHGANGDWQLVDTSVFYGPDGGDPAAVWISPQDDLSVVTDLSAGSGIWQSSKGDGGARVWSFTNLDTYSAATSVWGSGDGHIFATTYTMFHNKGDGIWVPEKTPMRVNYVWGTSSHDIYGLSEIDYAVFHSTGDGTWVAQPGPFPSGSEDWCYTAIWGSSPTDLYVVTGEGLSATGTILHSDGSGTWTTVRSGLAGLTAVTGTSKSDVYAVGENGTIVHFH